MAPGPRSTYAVDRVTKRFYERFKVEHDAFAGAIAGIATDETRAWYASLMLNRLMIAYFIQKKGLLDGDQDYLGHQLERTQATAGPNQFDRFYRSFLLRFFHEGLGLTRGERAADLEALIGRVPYLNGGLFELHQIERDNPEIAIPDAAFARIFTFFDEYHWHLDDQHVDPQHSDKEINPDVLGYIFEKYINQKQMGAYYTKEDITEYIGKNTIVPYLLDAAERECPVAFAPDGEVWHLLRDDPDRYIYNAVRQGTDWPLPDEIAAGMGDMARRGGWNRPADKDYALPTETWREHVARRTRYDDLRQKLADGAVTSVNDLITYNLDLRRFAQDVIEQCEGPELLRAFWHAIAGRVARQSHEKSGLGVTVLDPACGSGAFLCAALLILEPLYRACLERMAAFVDQFDAHGETARAPDFRAVLGRVAEHPNRAYFILKSIIVNNLYGVDIMEEAVEIVKLRLFLKLVAQVDDPDNLVPLPDIDFNIRAGNTLVGFATYAEAERAVSGNLVWQQEMPRIAADAEALAGVFASFRAQQTQHGGKVTAAYKEAQRAKLAALGDTLDGFLAAEYGIDASHYPKARDYAAKLAAWRASHKPFHWFIEFYAIVQERGGFDVVIGNPPYMEYSKIRPEYTIIGFETERCGNLFAFVTERSLEVTASLGRMGLIVPLSLMATERMEPLQDLLLGANRQLWFSTYDVYPSKLFDGAKQRLMIAIVSARLQSGTLLTTRYNRWKADERVNLTASLCFHASARDQRPCAIPKIGSLIEATILAKIRRKSPALFLESSVPSFYVHRIPFNYIKAMDFAPYFWNEVDGEKKSEDYKPYSLRDQRHARPMLAALNSNLFFWWWYTLFEGYHCGRHEIQAFPIGIQTMDRAVEDQLSELSSELMSDFRRHQVRKEAVYKTTGRVRYDEFSPRLSKALIDEIDQVLARHYAFTDAEVDYLINYDAKYRSSSAR